MARGKRDTSVQVYVTRDRCVVGWHGWALSNGSQVAEFVDRRMSTRVVLDLEGEHPKLHWMGEEDRRGRTANAASQTLRSAGAYLVSERRALPIRRDAGTVRGLLSLLALPRGVHREWDHSNFPNGLLIPHDGEEVVTVKSSDDPYARLCSLNLDAPTWITDGVPDERSYRNATFAIRVTLESRELPTRRYRIHDVWTGTQVDLPRMTRFLSQLRFGADAPEEIVPALCNRDCAKALVASRGLIRCETQVPTVAIDGFAYPLDDALRERQLTNRLGSAPLWLALLFRAYGVRLFEGVLTNANFALLHAVVDKEVAVRWIMEKFRVQRVLIGDKPHVRIGVRQDNGTTVWAELDGILGLDSLALRAVFVPYSEFRHFEPGIAGRLAALAEEEMRLECEIRTAPRDWDVSDFINVATWNHDNELPGDEFLAALRLMSPYSIMDVRECRFDCILDGGGRAFVEHVEDGHWRSTYTLRADVPPEGTREFYFVLEHRHSGQRSVWGVRIGLFGGIVKFSPPEARHTYLMEGPYDRQIRRCG